MTAWENLLAWRNARAREELTAGEVAYHDLPVGWYEDTTWYCERGHSTKGTRSPARCAICRDRVVLGPPGATYVPPVVPGGTPDWDAFNRARQDMLEAWGRIPVGSFDVEEAIGETACAMRQIMRVSAPEAQ